MRIIRMFSFTAIAAVASMASFDAAAALADEETVLCKKNEALCAKGNIYGKGTVIKAAAESISFLGQLNGKCQSAAFTEEITSEGGMGKTLDGEVLSQTFGSCEPCSHVLLIDKAFTHRSRHTNGILLYQRLSPVWEYLGCPFGTTCTFGGDESLEIINTAGGLPELIAKEEELKLKEGSEALCGASLKWDATYKLSAPDPVWLSLYQL